MSKNGIHTETVIDGALKLIVKHGPKESELYDLAADPHEQADLAAQSPEEVARLRALLDAHREDNLERRAGQGASLSLEDSAFLREQLDAIGYTDDGKAQMTLDEEARERLRSLGYTDE